MSAASETPAPIFHEEYPPPFRPLLLLVFPILPIFWTYRVDIADKHLTFGYSYAYKVIEKNSSIITATPIEHVNGLKSWGGWGIRINLSGEIGYIAKNGRAVRIEVKNKKDNNDNADDDEKTKVYVFSCDEALRVCRILNGCED